MQLRIVGSKIPATSGLKVYDAETGDEVEDVMRVDLALSASPGWITAQVTRYERNERGEKFSRGKALAQTTEPGNVVAVDVTTKSSGEAS